MKEHLILFLVWVVWCMFVVGLGMLTLGRGSKQEGDSIGQD